MKKIIDKINALIMLVIYIMGILFFMWLMISFIDCVISIFLPNGKEELLEHFWNYFVMVANRLER